MFTIAAEKSGDRTRYVVRGSDGVSRTMGSGAREFDTLEAAQVAANDERCLERFNQVRAWLRGCGCCYLCSAGMAIAKVESEAGRRYDWKAIRGECMGVKCNQCEGCRHSVTCVVPRSCETIAAENRAICPPAPPQIQLAD